MGAVILFDNFNINNVLKKTIDSFIGKEKNLNYLRKIAKQFEKAIVLKDFNAIGLYQDKYIAEENGIKNEISTIKKICF